MSKENYIITIGRQIGSGGADMGRRVANALGFRYLDRQILTNTAEELRIPEDNLELIEERTFSIWQAMLQSSSYDARFMLSDYYLPTGGKLFETQTEIIKKATAECAAVIVGRCGNYIFRDNPKAVRIFLHAAPDIRTKQVAKRFNLTEDKAKKEMKQIDKERDRYYNTYTGRKRQDVTEYELSLDTGLLGMDLAFDIIIDYIRRRFPELSAKEQNKQE